MSTSSSDRLRDGAAAILASYREHRSLALIDGACLPSREAVWDVVEDLLRLLFPGFLEVSDLADDVVARTEARVRSIAQRLRIEIENGLCFGCDAPGDARERAEEATVALLEEIPAVRAILASDVQAAYEGDPAAHSLEEIVLAYPGLQAIAVYRMAHVLYRKKVPIVPRVMTEYAHSRTGIDIHPGATIGRSFFIDHGTGVVIGETCVIGEGVKIYQGVTLGAQSFPRDERGRVIKGTKRHPDIDDGATIYSGATILGPVRIGRGAIIGGNVWVTSNVPPGTRIVTRPGQQIHLERPVQDYQI